MTEEMIWGLVVVALTPTLGFIMWRWAKPHQDKIEDSNSLATSIQAIGEAAVKVVGASTDVSELMQGFLEPLRVELEDQRQLMIDQALKHNVEIETMRHELLRDGEQCAYHLQLLTQHVADLRRRMRDHDIDPGDPPEELGHLQFD